MKPVACENYREGRRSFIGGSDARIIMGTNEEALVRVWREKRGEADPPDYSDNLVVQLGLANIRRPALLAPAADGGKEILALRGERRATFPLRCRTTTPPHRSNA